MDNLDNKKYNFNNYIPDSEYQYQLQCLTSCQIQDLIESQLDLQMTKKFLSHIIVCSKCKNEYFKTKYLFERLSDNFITFKKTEPISNLFAEKLVNQILYTQAQKNMTVIQTFINYLINFFIKLQQLRLFSCSKYNNLSHYIKGKIGNIFYLAQSASVSLRIVSIIFAILLYATWYFLINTKINHHRNSVTENELIEINPSVKFTYTVSAPINNYLLEVDNLNKFKQLPLQGILRKNTIYKLPSFTKVFISYDKENMLSLSNKATFKIDESSLYLQYGDLYCRIKNSACLLQICTKYVKITPKRSEFYLEARHNSTRVTLESGTIVLQSEKDKLLFKKNGTLFILQDGTITTNFEPSDVYNKLPVSSAQDFKNIENTKL